MYEDWFLLVEISSVLLGGGRSIQLSYGGIRLYFTIRSADCQCVIPIAGSAAGKTVAFRPGDGVCYEK